MEIGELITRYRKSSSLTIDELADRSGVPKGTLNKIIGGVTKAPTLDNMKSIARALGKTLADFDDPLEIENAPEITPEGKYKKLIEKLDRLTPVQLAKVEGFIDCMVMDNEAAETAKQISGAAAV